MKQMQRDTSVDYAKGLGIFFVVWSHISLGWILDEFTNVTILGMFFILSGMFYKTGQHMGKVVSKECIRLGIPFLVFALIGYFFQCFYTLKIDKGEFDYWMWITDFLAGVDYRTNIPLWFLFSLFEIILLFNVLHKFKPVVQLLVCGVMAIIGMVLLSNNINYGYIGKSFYYLLFFYIGHSTFARWREKVTGNSLLICALCLITIFILWLKTYFIHSVMGDYLVGGISVVTFTLCILELFAQINPSFRFIQYLGRNSLIIFCVHIMIVSVVYRLFYSLFSTPSVLLSFVYAVFVIILCLPVIKIYGSLFPTPKRKR